MPKIFRRHKIFTSLLIALLVLLVTAFVFVRIGMHGPYRDYRVDTEFISAPAGTT